MGKQLLGASCWYCENCITKLWALSSYFFYLYMVFIQHCFQLEQHCFHLDRQFSCYSNISNWLSRIPTQSSLVIQNSCSSWLSCTLSLLLSIPSDWNEQLLTALDTFSRNQHHMPLHKGHQILGTLHSVFLSVPGSDVTFSCLQKTLWDTSPHMHLIP